MPKLIDYGRTFIGYFTKNYGINSITTAIVPAVVQAAAIGSPDVAQTIQSSFDPATVQTIQQGGAGATMALIMISLRIVMAIARAL
ncbi:hypothetical protein CSIRO_3057 [Bradyrhizobiaceae bacterium SG-6C]|nr:hypothetical protein CSIRO_3057 [Bradyrhizobiaceae bacterium SG-6C]